MTAVPSCPICGKRTAEASPRGGWWCWTCNTIFTGTTGEWEQNSQRREWHETWQQTAARSAEKLAAIRATKDGAAAMTGKEPKAQTA